MPIRPIFPRKHYTYPRTSRERYELKKIYKKAIGVIIIGNGQEFIVKDGRFLTIKYPEFDEILEVVNDYVSRMMVDASSSISSGSGSGSVTSQDEDTADTEDTDDTEDTEVVATDSRDAVEDDCSFVELNNSLRKFMALVDEYIVGMPYHHNNEHR